MCSKTSPVLLTNKLIVYFGIPNFYGIRSKFISHSDRIHSSPNSSYFHFHYVRILIKILSSFSFVVCFVCTVTNFISTLSISPIYFVGHRKFHLISVWVYTCLRMWCKSLLEIQLATKTELCSTQSVSFLSFMLSPGFCTNATYSLIRVWS